ncbi:hypothetical protein CDES_11940 [Corynebacterium deserti GIMN1.010]|uniref:DUF306 domain-containing protein n=1 Tax=Corynebacterium deserti GIMN1.010 TaxID=931089 RepID=A0A0M4CHQ5_9CORY|nr:hypothetical protein [Corynebacterium deserti]ALC06740.1 hypothetical protein CDES_11940 [Corynebacterium deserti GIMN1.010]
MKRFLAGVVGVSTIATLAACGSDVVEMTDSTWLVTNIYTSPDEPHAISDLVVNQPSLDFGNSSLSGFTGCVPFTGRAEFLRDGEPSTVADANYVTLSSLDFNTIDDDCIGQERLVHDRMVELLPGSFEISRSSDSEILLTLDVDELDRPSMRLLSWIAPSAER